MCDLESRCSSIFLCKDNSCFALSAPNAEIKHPLHSCDNLSPCCVWVARELTLLHTLHPSLLSLLIGHSFCEQKYIIWSCDQQSGQSCLVGLLLTSLATGEFGPFGATPSYVTRFTKPSDSNMQQIKLVSTGVDVDIQRPRDLFFFTWRPFWHTRLTRPPLARGRSAVRTSAPWVM